MSGKWMVTVYLALSTKRIDIRNYQSLLAFVFAVTEINKNPRLLPNITLGFHIVDHCLTEAMATIGMINIMTGKGLPIPNYRWGLSPNLVAVVDGISSKVTLLIARMFGIYRFPQMHKYIKKVSITGGDGNELHFDENGDMPSDFDILNWIVYPNQTLDGIKVGTYAQRSASQELRINESLIRWSPSFNETPRTPCSETCLIGFRNKPKEGFPECCNDCAPCPEGEICNQTEMAELSNPETMIYSMTGKPASSNHPAIVNWNPQCNHCNAVRATLLYSKCNK
eukprot:XP_002936748.2 PREDICTED: vomeronasal type-2 receptor 26-like [Xenopus tropicalis]